MLKIHAPVIIKIRDGITVNLSQSYSQAIELDQPQQVLNKDFNPTKENPTPGKDDYEITEKCNAVSFWFADGRSLCYRVGHEITQGDFDRIKSQMMSLQFRTKDDRVSSNVQTVK